MTATSDIMFSQRKTESALWKGFLCSALRHPLRPALTVENRTLTYADLACRAKRIAAVIQAQSPSNDPPLTAVFAYRTATAFAGVLGALLAGNGFVPLNRTFPKKHLLASAG